MITVNAARDLVAAIDHAHGQGFDVTLPRDDLHRAVEVVRPGGDAWWFATVDEFIDAFAEGVS